MTYKIFGGKTYNLNGSISSTATEIVLSSFLEPVTNTPLTMALIGSDIVYATISPRTNSSEFISFTGITQNSNGTATLTGVTRGLAKKDPFTANASYRLPHSGGAEFIISNPPQHYNKYAVLENDNTFTGENTFTINPRKGATTLASNNDDYITKADLLNAVLGSVNTDQVVIGGTAGENLTAGNIVYFKEADQKWWKADADLVGTFDQVIVAIAQDTVLANGAVNVLLQGLDENQTGMTLGAKYYLSNTAGAISTTPGTTEVFMGWAQTATRFIFDPLGLYQPSSGQKAALAGSSGIPSNTNRYITQDDVAENTASKVVRRKSNSNVTVPTTPTDTTDATSKSYVDTTTGVVDTTSYVLGESFTGATTPQPCTIIDDLYQYAIGDASGGTNFSTGDHYFGETTQQQRAVRIIPRRNVTIASVIIQLAKAGTPTDNVSIEIQTDSSGVPSGTPVTNGTSSTVSGSSLSSSEYQEHTLTFSTPPSLVANTTYWAVFKRSSSLSGSNYYLTPTAQPSKAFGSFVGARNNGSWSASSQQIPTIRLVPATGSSLSLWQCDADGSWNRRQFFGFCTTTGSAGDNATLVRSGVLGGFSSLNIGTDYAISTTAGAITNTSGGTYVGTAISATQISIPRIKFGDGTLQAPFSFWGGNGTLSGPTTGPLAKIPFNGTFAVYWDSSGSNLTATVSVAGTYARTTTYQISTTSLIDSTSSIPYSRGNYISFNSGSTSGGSLAILFTPIIE